MIAQAPTQNQAYRTAFLAALAEAATPIVVGYIHAEKGEPCNPHDLYTHDGEIAEYIEGYQSVSPAPATKQLLACGRINGGERTLTARSFFDNREVVEHTVNAYLPGKVMAEIRINDRLLFRRAFAGDEAVSDAIGWCDGTAPLADVLDFAAAAQAAQREQETIDAIFGPIDADEPPMWTVVEDDEGEGCIEDDHDDIRRG